MERQCAWKTYSASELKKLEQLSAEYRVFLDAGKTERECAAACARMAEDAGFADLDKDVSPLRPGSRLYKLFMGKSVLLFILGKRPLRDGMRVLGAHIDSPRIDIKQNPVYEDAGFAYLDTHYYGYIKSYQWVAMPLALHGVIVRKSGESVNVSIGEDENDPVFTISDLLPHLADEQLKKDGGHLYDNEALDLLVGSRPLQDVKENPVKAYFLSLLREKYGIEEEDFLSAELEIVPAGKCREMGLDKSMLIGYGHDDRVCAFPSARALLDFDGIPEYTLCCVLTDKEEIGSVGATGMRSDYFVHALRALLDLAGQYSEINLDRMLENSAMLSSDVSAGYDPLYASVFEKKNSAYLGKGVCLNKYTGMEGKGGSNDANAEFIAWLRRVMEEAGVSYQTAELGKVDAGGGGTIAYMCARYGMNVIDCGVPVLSMHAPWETISKADLYEAYKCYCAFLRA